MADYGKLLDFLPGEMEFWGIPGMSYGIIKDGEVIAKGGFGSRDLANALPADADTLYGIASCSKSFNSCLLAMLADDGLLDLDRPIREYVPGFAMYDETATREITARDMLCHRTGLAPHEATWPDPSCSKKELLMKLRYLRPNARFRTVAQYNNTIFSAAAALAEIVTGDTWEHLIEERIFRPLGMDASMLSAHAMYEQENHAQGYWNWEDGRGPVPVGPWEMDVAGGACGVVTNVTDMMKWITLHMQNGVFEGKRLVSEEMMREMHSVQFPMKMFALDYPEIAGDGGYGLGWFIQNYRGYRYVWHTGEIEGFCTFEGFLPDAGIGLFLAMNIHKPLNMPLIRATCFTVFDRLLGLPERDWLGRTRAWRGQYSNFYYHWENDLFKDAPPAVPGTRPSHLLEAYTGRFHHPGYGTYEIALEDGKMVLHYKDLTAPMEHRHYDVWKVIRMKQDTTLVTAPLIFRTDPYTGEVESFAFQIEPTLSPEVFHRVD